MAAAAEDASAAGVRAVLRDAVAAAAGGGAAGDDDVAPYVDFVVYTLAEGGDEAEQRAAVAAALEPLLLLDGGGGGAVDVGATVDRLVAVYRTAHPPRVAAAVPPAVVSPPAPAPAPTPTPTPIAGDSDDDLAALRQKNTGGGKRGGRAGATPASTSAAASAAASASAAAAAALTAALFARPPDAPHVLSADDADSRVCRFYLAGGCTARACPFLHDTRTVPCRFWLAGGPAACAHGDACAFSHSAPRAAADDGAGDDGGDGDDIEWMLAELAADAPDEADDTGGAPPASDTAPPLVGDYNVDFPATLPASSSAAGGGGSGAPPSTSALTFSQQVALMALQHSFPGVPRGTVAARFHACGRVAAAAAAAITAETGTAPRPPPPPRAAPAAGGSRRPRTGGGSSSSNAAMAAAIGRGLPWVDTGAAVASVYAAHRRDAEALAKARNTAFERATAAFTAGDSAGAAALSRQGRALDDRMRAAHMAAAAAIYASRNASGGGARSSGGSSDLPPATLVAVDVGGGRELVPVHVFDLHGLHPPEAAGVATAALRAAPRDAWLAFLVGTRHHSKRLGKGGGSVADAVAAACDDAGAEWHTASAGGADTAGGALVVRAA